MKYEKLKLEWVLEYTSVYESVGKIYLGRHLSWINTILRTLVHYFIQTIVKYEVNTWVEFG